MSSPALVIDVSPADSRRRDVVAVLDDRGCSSPVQTAPDPNNYAR